MTKIVPTIFDIYTGIFIPRFSYSIKDAQSIEKLWFGLALYPGDKKNDFNEPNRSLLFK